MTPSTTSCTLWTMNPSRMSYRDHGKPCLAPFRIRKSTLLGPILTTYLSMTVLQDLSITQLWNVLLHHFVGLFGRVLSLCCCLCAELSSRLRDLPHSDVTIAGFVLPWP